jgi:signal peptidase I
MDLVRLHKGNTFVQLTRNHNILTNLYMNQQPKHTMRKIGKVVYILLAVILIGVGSLVVLSALGISNQLHGFIVQTGSMEPAIRTGSFIIVRPQEAYAAGDIITYRWEQDPDTTITHRIIDVEEQGGVTSYVTKGDANEANDGDPIAHDTVVGAVVFSVPYIGYPIAFAQTMVGFMLLIILPATFIIYHEASVLRREINKRIRQKNQLPEFIERM